MITIRQLKYFDALARFEHFGKAADAVAISQPALSMQIKEMEEILGVTLIERSSKGVTLTAEGREISRRGKVILTAIQDLSDFARHSSEPLTGPLRLGIIPSIAPYMLPKALPLLQVRFPDLQLQVRETQTKILLEELDRGELDALLLAVPVEYNDAEVMEITSDPFLLAARSDTEGVVKGWPAEKIVSEEKLLLLEEGHCLRDQALNYCMDVGADSLKSFGASSLSTIMQLVAHGYGVTLLPKICVDAEIRDDRIALLEFSEKTPQRMIGLAWRASSPRAEEFRTLGQAFIDAVNRS